MQLETDRLILRNFKTTDIDDYWEYVQMPNVGPRAGWPAYTDKNKAKERLEFEAKKPLVFAIIWKEENKVIGSIELMECVTDRYFNIKIEDNSKEIGYVLSEKYWGKGIMPEASKAIMKYAFETLGIDVIYTGHAKANTNSQRVQEKLGFKIIGEYDNYSTWIDGTKTGFIERKMTKSEWLEMNKQ